MSSSLAWLGLPTPKVMASFAPEAVERIRRAASAEEAADAMAAALVPDTRARLRASGLARAAAHTWRGCAERHLDAYAACARAPQEPIHA